MTEQNATSRVAANPTLHEQGSRALTLMYEAGTSDVVCTPYTTQLAGYDDGRTVIQVRPAAGHVRSIAEMADPASRELNAHLGAITVDVFTFRDRYTACRPEAAEAVVRASDPAAPMDAAAYHFAESWRQITIQAPEAGQEPTEILPSMVPTVAPHAMEHGGPELVLQMIEGSMPSADLQRQLGLADVSAEEQERIAALFNVLALQSGGLVENHGLRASQSAIRGLWVAAHNLVRSNASLTTCIGTDMSASPVYAVTGTEVLLGQEPHRTAVFERDVIARRAATVATRLQVDGSLFIRDQYAFLGMYDGGIAMTHPARMTMRLQRNAGREALRSLELLDVRGTGLRMARVDGTPLAPHSNVPAAGGRYLTAAEARDLTELVTDLQHDPEPTRLQRVFGRLKPGGSA